MAHLNNSKTTETPHPRQAPTSRHPAFGRPHFKLGAAKLATPLSELASARLYPTPRQPRYRSLTAWRGLACLLVVVFHSLFYCNAVNAALEPSAQSQMLRLTERFWIGVPLFFVISGYCIAAAVDSHRLRGDSGIPFFVRRIKRIVPPYWCALGVSLAVVLLAERWLWPGLFVDQIAGVPDPTSLNAWHWFGNIALIESWRYHVTPSHPVYFLGNAWTLFYEEQFYVVSGLILVLSPRRFFVATAVVTVLTLAARHFGHYVGLDVHGTFLDGHWLMFAAGIAVYHFANHASTRQKWCIIAMLIAGLVYVCRDLSLVWSLPNNFQSNALAAFCFAIVLTAARRWDGAIMNLRGLAPIRFCGDICYSLYLVHWPICKATSHLLHDAGVRGPWGAAFIILPCCAGASVAAGYAFHVLIERRFLNAPMLKA